jgi:iduronate 2-sulfatase
VPLIIRCPWMPASHGVKTPALVEAVDLYQTIAALAGLPDPASGDDYPVQNVQGNCSCLYRSHCTTLLLVDMPCLGSPFVSWCDPSAALLPYFLDPPTNGTGTIKKYAFSQFNKHNTESGPYGLQPWDPCTKCNFSEWDYVGLSLRDDRWRYTEWVKWDKAAHGPQWGVYGVGGGAELYDHEGDFGADMDVATDTINVAHEAQYADVVQTLSAALRQHFLGDH